MTRETYQQSLDRLEADVLEMGSLVLDRFEQALESLESGDEALAEHVIEGDGDVNERYLELEQRCVDLYALQQPVASDLRFVTASFKIITDLERIGDLASNLASYALAADRTTVSAVEPTDIGRAAHELVGDALEAYENEDASNCHGIAERDDGIDARCQNASDRLVRELIERRGSDGEPTAWDVEVVMDDVSRVLLTIRDIERVADHGVNIAARTLYHVEGDPALLY